MQTTYKFDPSEDLTVLDLAEILDIPVISQADFDKLPARLQRHFKVTQIFEKTVADMVYPQVPDVRPVPVPAENYPRRGRKSK